jgi:hypothetical protein
VPNNADTARILAVRAALLQTTATVGWGFIKQMADNVVAQATQACLEEDDRELGESKRLQAKALRDGFKKLFDGIEATKNIDIQAEDLDLDELEIG